MLPIPPPSYGNYSQPYIESQSPDPEEPIAPPPVEPRSEAKIFFLQDLEGREGGNTFTRMLTFLSIGECCKLTRAERRYTPLFNSQIDRWHSLIFGENRFENENFNFDEKKANVKNFCFPNNKFACFSIDRRPFYSCLMFYLVRNEKYIPSEQPLQKATYQKLPTYNCLASLTSLREEGIRNPLVMRYILSEARVGQEASRLAFPPLCRALLVDSQGKLFPYVSEPYVDIIKKNTYCCTLLSWLGEEGHHDKVAFLVEMNVNPNIYDFAKQIPLYWATTSKQSFTTICDIVDLLLEIPNITIESSEFVEGNKFSGIHETPLNNFFKLDNELFLSEEEDIGEDERICNTILTLIERGADINRVSIDNLYSWLEKRLNHEVPLSKSAHEITLIILTSHEEIKKIFDTQNRLPPESSLLSAEVRNNLYTIFIKYTHDLSPATLRTSSSMGHYSLLSHFFANNYCSEITMNSLHADIASLLGEPDSEPESKND